LTKASVGDVAPDFTLLDQRGKPVRLHELTERKNVALYFYPKDATPGCTIEARSFRDAYTEFAEADTEVVGISSDSVKSHERFAANERLPFLLLSDRDGAVRKLYGVERTLGVLPGRVTYVIGRGGVIRHVYNSQLRVTRHSREALQALNAPPPSPP
jgi:peroxiredoxin Q/BCP